MGSLFASFFSPVVAGGLFSTLNTGQSNIRNNWDRFAQFGGVVVIAGAVIFLCIAVLKSRDKARWYWSSIIAFVVGAVLIVAGSTNKIQGDFSSTWTDVFGGGYATMLPLAFHNGLAGLSLLF